MIGSLYCFISYYFLEFLNFHLYVQNFLPISEHKESYLAVEYDQISALYEHFNNPFHHLHFIAVY